MTNTEVHEKLVAWLATVLGITVIKDRQGADRPDNPYGVLDFITWSELTDRPSNVAYEQLDTLNSAGLNEIAATPLVPLEWTFIFFVYGDNGAAYMRKLQNIQHLSQIQEPLLPSLVIHDIGVVNSIPELVDEVWEPRWQVNIMVHGWSDDSAVIDTIETHNFEYTRI